MSGAKSNDGWPVPSAPRPQSLCGARATLAAKSLFSLRPTPARKDDDDNDEASMHRALDPCRYLLSLAMTAPAGQGVFYNTGALTLVSALSERPPGALAPTYGRAETSIQWCDYSITS